MNSRLKIAVTGAAGFIGSHLTESLLGEGHHVTGIDAFSDYYGRDIKQRNLAAALRHESFQFCELDLAADDLRAALDGVEVVYHLAGRPGVRAAITQFDLYLRENIVATQHLLEAAKELDLKCFVYAGSSSVYGDAEAFPTAESATPAPLSPYGVTKLAGEHLTYVYWKNFHLPAVRLRYFSVYGPRMRPDLMLARAMRALHDGTVFEIYGDGEQTREFTYVSDAVSGTILGAQRGVSCDVYNLGGGTSVTVNAVLKMLEETSGLELKRKFVQARLSDHRHAGASITRARIQLGWEPRVPLSEGLAAQWKWFVDHEAPASSLGGRESRTKNR